MKPPVNQDYAAWQQARGMHAEIGVSAATGVYEAQKWQIVTDNLGYESIHETDEDGRPGDLVANAWGDQASLLAAAPRLRSALINLLAIAGTPTTDRQTAVFCEARNAIAASASAVSA